MRCTKFFGKCPLDPGETQEEGLRGEP
eukprot:COSAG04_NODE_19145_length_423_cov_1.114198_1_plen_26_part_10